MALWSRSVWSAALATTKPTVEGHTLVLPKRHVHDYFALSEREQRACWLLVNRERTVLREERASDPFRAVALKLHRPGRETFKHAHPHVISL